MHTTYILSYYTCHVYHNEFKVATFPSQHHKMENMEGAPTQIFRPHHPTTKTQRSHILYMYHNGVHTSTCSTRVCVRAYTYILHVYIYMYIYNILVLLATLDPELCAISYRIWETRSELDSSVSANSTYRVSQGTK